MDKNFKGTPEEYIEFRKTANERNRKYYSKPDVKAARKAYKQVYEKKNKDRINFLNRERRKRLKPLGLLWSQKYPDKIKAYRQTKEFKLRKREQDKRWRDKNKEKLILKRADPEFRAKKKIIYNKNKEHLRELRRAYYKTERGILSYKRRNHIKLAIRKDRPTDLTREKIKELFERDKVCVYCGNSEKLEIDHVVPLDKGGSCMFNNLVIACAKCNRSKSGRDVIYWCNLEGIEIPKIVLEILKNQNLN